MRAAWALGALLFIAGPAAAEVVASSPNGFHVRHSVSLVVPTEAAFAWRTDAFRGLDIHEWYRFVDADMDVNNPQDPQGLRPNSILAKARKLVLETEPISMNYRLRGRVQVFDTDNPAVPRIWAFNWKRTVDVADFYNVTASVFDDMDSQRTLGDTARAMSRDMLFVMPREVYLDKHVETGVKAQILSRHPNARETHAIEQILERN